MKRAAALISVLALLASCGVNGAPSRPVDQARKPGISGESYFGYDSRYGLVQGTKINLHFGS
ncbi:MAG: hypothetical protein ACJA06_000634 [Halocynthiibacter sp.]|jgi:hypothetical protein